MGNEFINGNVLYADELNEIVDKINQVYKYQKCIRVGTTNQGKEKKGSLNGGLGAYEFIEQSPNFYEKNHIQSDNCLVFGKGLIAKEEGQILFGQYNWQNAENLALGIGNGQNHNKRSNLLSIYRDGTINVNILQDDNTSIVGHLVNNLELNTVKDSLDDTMKKNKADADGKIKINKDNIGILQTRTQKIEERIGQLYPEGAIYVTSVASSKDVASAIGYGDWKLIDKEFESKTNTYKGRQIMYIPEKKEDVVETSSGLTATELYATKSGHAVRLRLDFTIQSKKLHEFLQKEGDKMCLGQLNLANLGLKEFSFKFVSVPIMSDKSNCLLMATIYQNGVIYINDYIDRTKKWEKTIDTSKNKEETLKVVTDTYKGSTDTEAIPFYLNLDIVSAQNKMLSSACDKFYYQRTGKESKK